MEEPSKQIKFMTYNVWSREDVVLYTRMQAIGRIVKQQSPDVIFFQVEKQGGYTVPYIHKIFQSFDWWEEYHCSPPPVSPEELATEKHFCLMLSKVPLENFARWKFTTTSTGRAYLEAEINPDQETTTPIRIATTQLECPSPPAPMHCMERYMQAEHAVAALDSAENVVFGGDMSWDDNTDLPFPLPAGWVDAWTKIKPHKDGNTRDGDWIAPFRDGGLCSAPWKRSDRFACKLRDYTVTSIELVGTYGSGVEVYVNEMNRHVELRPSCHRGVVLTIVPSSVPIVQAPLVEEVEDEDISIHGLFVEEVL